MLKIATTLPALLLLAACSATPAPEPVPPPAPTTVQPAATQELAMPQREQLYVNILRDYGVPLTDDELTTIGPRVCTLFDEGSRYGVVERGVVRGEPELTQAQAGYIIGAAIAAYCVEHSGKIPTSG